MWSDSSRHLFKTSGFRLAVRSLALSLGGAILVFVIIHHAAEIAWRGQIDDAVAAALSDILSDIHHDQQPVAQNVTETLAEGGGLFFADLGADQRWEAGNFHLSPALMHQWNGMHTFNAGDGLTLPSRIKAIRGLGHRFPDGETLFIAADATALLSLNKVIAQSFLAVFGIIMALGLLNGYFAARSAQRRVDAFATTLSNIVQGDLSRRFEVTRGGDEFDRLATSMNAMLQRLQELMDNLRQVTSDISHDLRSPLARLREHLELSKARWREPKLQEVFDEALTQVDQALGIFAAMLRIAEVEAGTRRAHFAEVQLSNLLLMLAESYEPAFSAAGISIETDIALDLTLQGDAELLAQLFTNILDNILLHAENATLATIRALQANHQISIEIADNGNGIPPPENSHVLQRFVRLDASRHRPGHGLGLPLVLAIAALHDAQINLEDHQPGLKVTINLRQPPAPQPGK